MRVLTWNLFHGRSVPAAGHALRDEFAAALAGWAWDVALLQEVPPWWPEPLGEASGAAAASALTSRNLGLPVRRALAGRWPDVLKSNGGGSNAVLVRGAAIAEVRSALLRRLPERRVVLGVRLGDGTWVANLHGQGAKDESAGRADLARAAATVLGWAGAHETSPVVLGGDVNLRRPAAPPGFAYAGGTHVDHLFARGLHATGDGAEILDAGRLSDHAPIAVTLTEP